jgi:hypothetical protein
MEKNNIQEKIRQYFRSKTKQILALSEQAVSDHSGLTGSHRESVLRQFFDDIFPKRYSIDKGMVYGFVGQSREADIVIWDEQNYPKLKLSDSNVFFLESVKAVVEVKSNWNINEFEDIKKKSKAVINIFGRYRDGLSKKIEALQTEIWSLKTGDEYHGTLISPRRIGSAAIIYYGGQDFNIEKLDESETSRIEDEYPDIMLFLSAGKLIRKKFIANENNSLAGHGILEQIEYGDDSLLAFTLELMDLLTMHSEHMEPPLFLTDYLYEFSDNFEVKQISFKITRPIASNSETFWKE